VLRKQTLVVNKPVELHLSTHTHTHRCHECDSKAPCHEVTLLIGPTPTPWHRLPSDYVSHDHRFGVFPGSNGETPRLRFVNPTFYEHRWETTN
jgi:hypothetical protein